MSTLVVWFPFAAFGIIVQLKFDRFCTQPPSNSSEDKINDTLTSTSYTQIPTVCKYSEVKTGDNEKRDFNKSERKDLSKDESTSHSRAMLPLEELC